MEETRASGSSFLYGVVATLCLGLGVLLGWAIWGRVHPVGPQPEIRQSDGSLVLEVKPTPVLNPPPTLPEKAKEARRVTVVLQPTNAECPPVEVNLSHVRMPDGSSRVVAWSPDGKVNSGLDVPITEVYRDAVQNKTHWAAGVSYAGERAYGVFIHRDIWRVRMGLEVNANTDGGSEARLMAGWTW